MYPISTQRNVRAMYIHMYIYSSSLCKRDDLTTRNKLYLFQQQLVTLCQKNFFVPRNEEKLKFQLSLPICYFVRTQFSPILSSVIHRNLQHVSLCFLLITLIVYKDLFQCFISIVLSLFVSHIQF